MARARNLSRYLIAALGTVAATGCFDLSDNRGPVMSIELCWDESPYSAAFKGGNCTRSDVGTCDTAGVDEMTWSLKRADTGEEVAGDTERCANGIDVIEPTPGRYTLEITATNKDGDPVWDHTCKGLDVLRFDVGYECDVDANATPPATDTTTSSTEK